MRTDTQKKKRRLINFFSDPLYRNSLYLILTSSVSAFSGFLFWLIAARLYPTKDVGTAAAIIALGQFVGNFSLLGFDYGTIKFINECNPSKVISTSVTFTVIVSFISASTVTLFIGNISPKIAKILNFPINIFFVLFVTLMTLSAIFRQGIFVAIRDTKNSFIQSLMALPRLVILIVLTSLYAIGIFLSFTVTPLLASCVSIYIITRSEYNLKFKIDWDTVRSMITYSLGNYISTILEILPNFTLPIIVVNSLGPTENAYFYIPWSISLLIAAIPKSTSMSLFAECSYSKNSTIEKIVKSIVFTIPSVIASIIFIWFGGTFLLSLFGKKYTLESINLLKILVLAVIPYSICTVYIAICRAEKNIKGVIFNYFTVSITTIILSYTFIKKFGIICIGYSWLIGNILALAVVVLILLKRQNYKKLRKDHGSVIAN